MNTYEPPHDKTNKVTCAPSELRSSWASAQSDQSSLCAQWVAKNPSFLQVDSETDQTGQMPRAHISVCWFCHEAAQLYSTASFRRQAV